MAFCTGAMSHFRGQVHGQVTVARCVARWLEPFSQRRKRFRLSDDSTRRPAIWLGDIQGAGDVAFMRSSFPERRFEPTDCQLWA
jgi:hypothetical protein